MHKLKKEKHAGLVLANKDNMYRLHKSIHFHTQKQNHHCGRERERERKKERKKEKRKRKKGRIILIL